MKKIQQLAIVNVIILVIATGLPTFAQKIQSQKKVVSPKALSPIPNDFIDGLARIRTFTAERRYALVIMELNALAVRARDLQQQSIQAAIPGTPEGFEINPPNAEELDSPYVVFSRSYSNNDGTNFAIIVSMADPSIDEYQQMIQSPATISMMENTKIVEARAGFPGIEKYSPAEGTYERHIILGNNLMVAITGNGIQDRSGLDAFSDSIDLVRIQSELRQ
ncbi:hypothetical protein EBR57_00525 [bacterium]|nr:hypothetical protein [bacterium]